MTVKFYAEKIDMFVQITKALFPIVGERAIDAYYKTIFRIMDGALEDGDIAPDDMEKLVDFALAADNEIETFVKSRADEP